MIIMRIILVFVSHGSIVINRPKNHLSLAYLLYYKAQLFAYWVKISADNILNFFFFSYFFSENTFHANCPLKGCGGVRPLVLAIDGWRGHAFLLFLL